MNFVISVAPVAIFLLFLIFMDSFKIVKLTQVLFCIVWGITAAGISYDLNTFLLTNFDIQFTTYSHYIAPIVEELLKISIIIILINMRKIGFIVDGAIMGFAAGAGFSILENIYYFRIMDNPAPLIWIIRGFGTAVMHGGVTSIVSIFIMSAVNSEKSGIVKTYLPGLLIAMVIHSLYNHFFISPILSTMILFILIPSTIILIFQKNQSDVQKWLDVEFDTEAELLSDINKGKFSETRSGMFILSLKEQFKPEIFFDMLVFVKLFLELSVKAKGILLLQESGLTVPKDPEMKSKLIEFDELEKNIGKTGLLALQPILRMNKKDLWKLKMLE